MSAISLLYPDISIHKPMKKIDKISLNTIEVA